MLKQTIYTLKDFWFFLKKPKIYLQTKNSNFQDKLIISLFVFPLFAFIGASFLWFLVELCQKYEWFYLGEEDANAHRGMVFNLVITVIITPLLEETVFRFPLKYFVDKSYFAVLFYLFTIVFGLVHFFNYQMNLQTFSFILLIVSPQIWAGLCLGFLRVHFGFWYACLCHAMYNLLGFIELYQK